ncbi:MAG: hypothetical protein AAF206_28910 [Bacteroidota bacterium]
MRKPWKFILFVSLSPIIAGLYGFLHNQISFLFSTEYFSQFKLAAFGLGQPILSDRIRAGMFGLLSSWWLGFLFAFVIAVFAWQKIRTAYLQNCFRAAGIIILVSLGSGLLGLIIGYIFSDMLATGVFIPPGVADTTSFVAVGIMQKMGFYGVFPGLVIAVLEMYRRN